jgi:hypothetical protein
MRLTFRFLWTQSFSGSMSLISLENKYWAMILPLIRLQAPLQTQTRLQEARREVVAIQVVEGEEVVGLSQINKYTDFYKPELIQCQ